MMLSVKALSWESPTLTTDDSMLASGEFVYFC
jgi:hypothetical protein